MLSEGLLTHSKCLSLFQLEYLIETVFGNQSRASQHICLLQPKTKEKKEKKQICTGLANLTDRRVDAHSGAEQTAQ